MGRLLRHVRIRWTVRGGLVLVAVAALVFAIVLRPRPWTPNQRVAIADARMFLSTIHPDIKIYEYEVVSVQRVVPGNDYGWRVDFTHPTTQRQLHAECFFGETSVTPFRR